MHTLRIWGNKTHHWNEEGFQSHFPDLVILFHVVLRLEDWIVRELEGGESIFVAEDLDAILRSVKDSLAGSDLPTEVVGAFIKAAGAGVQSGPHGLVAPHLSLELWWQRPVPLATDAGPCDASPYRGLVSFGPEDADQFYGRDKLRGQLIQMVETEPFTMVSGASGGGKTSLLRAGLLPALLDRGWVALYLGEYSAQALDTVLEVIRAMPAGRGSLVILDQLERALLAGVKPGVRRALLDLILPKAPPREGLRVVLGIREDFLGPLYRDADALAGSQRALVLHRGEVFVPVGPLGRNEAREAVVRPLEGTGVRMNESMLEEVLLPALVDQAGAPLVRLQIVCGRLFQEAREREIPVIDRDLYQQVGGVDKAIEAHLEQALSPGRYGSERDLARALLKVMTGIEARRWVDLGDLWQGIAPSGLTADEVELESVLGRLIDDRLVVSRKSGTGVSAKYSLMHDQLSTVVLKWNTPGELERLEAQEVLDRAVTGWGEQGRREVLSGRNLRIVATHYRLLAKPDRAASDALLIASRRARAGRRLVATSLVLVALLGMIFGMYEFRRAVVHQKVAREERTRAEDATDKIVFMRARKVLETNPTLALSWQRNLSPQADAGAAWGIMSEALSLGVAKVVSTGYLWFRRDIHGYSRPVALSPDGKYVATTIHEGVQIVETSGQMQRVKLLKGPRVSSPRISVAYSPDGRILAAGCRNGTIELWDVSTGTSLGTPLPGHKGPVTAVTFSWDGRLLASAGKDCKVRLWNTETANSIEAPLRPPPGHYCLPGFTSVDFSPDGHYLAAVGDEVSLYIWDLRSRKPLSKARVGNYTVAFSPDGKLLATPRRNDVVFLDVGNFKYAGSPLVGHQDIVTDVAFSPDGKFFAATWRSTAIRLWDAISFQLSGEPLRGHEDDIESLAFSPTGKILASGGRDRTVRLWDVESGRPLGNPLRRNYRAVYAVAFSPRGKILAFADEGGFVRLWDVATANLVTDAIRMLPRIIEAISFSPDGRYLATGGNDDAVQLYDVSSRKRLGGFPVYGKGAHSSVTAVAFSSDGKTLMLGRQSGHLQFMDVSTPTIPKIKKRIDALTNVQVSLKGEVSHEMAGP